MNGDSCVGRRSYMFPTGWSIRDAQCITRTANIWRDL